MGGSPEGIQSERKEYARLGGEGYPSLWSAGEGSSEGSPMSENTAGDA